MSKNNNQLSFTETDVARMHGDDVLSPDLKDKLGVTRSDVLMREAVDAIVLHPDPSPETLSHATGAFLHMLSKTRMAESAPGATSSGKSVAGERAKTIANFLASLGAGYQDVISRMGRGQLDQLAEILVTTGDMTPLMAQVEMGESLLPKRAQNIFRARAEKEAMKVEWLGEDGGSSAMTVLPFMQPDVRAAAKREVQAQADGDIKAHVARIRTRIEHIRDYKPGQDVKNDVGILRIWFSKILLTEEVAKHAKSDPQIWIGTVRQSLKRVFAKIPVGDQRRFFAGMAATGLMADVTKAIADKDSMLPLDVQRTITKWVAANAKTVQREEAATMLRGLESFKELAGYVVEHEKNTQKAEYAAYVLKDTTSMKRIGEIMAMVNATRNADSQLGFDALTRYLTTQAKVLQDMDLPTRHKFFEGLQKFGALDTVAGHIEARDSAFPVEVQRDLSAWLGAKAAPAAEPVLKVVELDRVLPLGETEPTDVTLTVGVRELRQGGTSLQTEPRIEWIIEGLKADGFDVSALTLYREKTLKTDPKRPPYAVLDVKGTDKDGREHAFQIAVCEAKGNGTYIIREPIDFANGAVVTIADLKRDKAVFQAGCYTQGQWLRSVRHYAYSKLTDLKIQLKTRTGWADKKDDLLQSFGEFYLETDQFPHVGDTSIIGHGPLSGKTTWARAYSALGKKSIKGLEHIRSFRQLTEEVFGAGALVPPSSVKEVGKTIDAVKLFNASVLYMSDHPNELPANDIGGEKIAVVNRSFRLGTVVNLDRVVPATNGGKLSSIQEFMVAVGLAEKGKKGVLTPVNPAIVQTLKRLVIGS